MSFMTCWNDVDIWFSARSVYTTEYSSSPSGSTFGSNPGTWLSGEGDVAQGFSIVERRRMQRVRHERNGLRVCVILNR